MQTLHVIRIAMQFAGEIMDISDSYSRHGMAFALHVC